MTSEQSLSVLLEEVRSAVPKCSNLRFQFNERKGDCVGGGERDNAMRSLRFLHTFYGFSPSSYFVAQSICDRFLSSVTVNMRYLTCVCLSCYNIAVSLSEPIKSRGIFSRERLIAACRASFSADDMHRMELTVLEKLNYKIDFSTTPLFFSDRFFSVIEKLCCLKFEDKLQREKIVNEINRNLQVVYCLNYFYRYKMYSVALAVIFNKLSSTKLIHIDTLRATVNSIMIFCSIDQNELMLCLNDVNHCLNDYIKTSALNCKPNPRALIWQISKRTLNHLGTGRQKCRILDLIPEVPSQEEITPSPEKKKYKPAVEISYVTPDKSTAVTNITNSPLHQSLKQSLLSSSTSSMKSPINIEAADFDIVNTPPRTPTRLATTQRHQSLLNNNKSHTVMAIPSPNLNRPSSDGNKENHCSDDNRQLNTSSSSIRRKLAFTNTENDTDSQRTQNVNVVSEDTGDYFPPVSKISKIVTSKREVHKDKDEVSLAAVQSRVPLSPLPSNLSINNKDTTAVKLNDFIIRDDERQSYRCEDTVPSDGEVNKSIEASTERCFKLCARLENITFLQQKN